MVHVIYGADIAVKANELNDFKLNETEYYKEISAEIVGC